MYKLRQSPHRWQWWHSLVARTVLLGGLALVLMVAAVIAQDTLRHRRTVSRAVMAQMALVTQAKSNDVTRWIASQRDVLAVVVESGAAQRWAGSVGPVTATQVDEDDPLDAEAVHAELSQLLLTFVRQHPGVREVAVLRAPNGVIAASSNSARVGEVRGEEPYYVQGSQGPYTSKAQTVAATGRTLMTLSTPLRTRSGVLAGVVVMELDLDWMQRTMLGRTGFAPAWERYLVDRSFQLLVGPGTVAGQRPLLWTGAADLLRSGGLPQGGGVGGGIYRNYQGEEVIGAYRWIETIDLALLVEANLAGAMRGQSREPLTRALPIASLMVGLLIGVAILTDRTIAQPLMTLRSGMLRVTGGELGTFAEELVYPAESPGEVRELVGAFGDMIRRIAERYAAMEARVVEHTEDLRRRSLQLEAAASVSSAVAAIRDVQELLDETVRLLPGYFDFDHVGVFLTDHAGEALVLRAASSEGGQRMMARGHQLRLGQGIVGTVAAEGKALIALDVAADDDQGALAVFFENPDLPDTRSEMALPLRVTGRSHPGEGVRSLYTSSRYMSGGAESADVPADGASEVRVVGVLDVQSNRPGAFTDEDVIVLQSVADQVALAMENAYLLEESERVLRELQMRYGEGMMAAWEHPLVRGARAYRYMGTGQVKAVDVQGSEDRSEPAGALEPSLRLGGRELHAPIVVRGHTLGSITLSQDAAPGLDAALHLGQRPSQDPWDEETLTLVRAVCGHIGEALENARLLNEAQLRAGYEQLTGDIAERIRGSAVDVDEVLRTTLHELGTTLGATGTIKLQPIGRRFADGADAAHVAASSSDGGGEA
jgi:GAF domain-containing protein